MLVQNSQLLPQDSKNLKFYQCALLAVDGPNIIGKINLGDVSINFNSQYTAKMILNAGAVNQPVLYGFLGNNITFLMLKINYDKTNPYCQIEEDNYIEYYLSDNKEIVRYIGELMILTGNSKNRIPQIYLNNPSPSNKITIDVMMANVEQEDLVIDDIKSELLFNNLYHRSIISNKVRINNYTGSTQLEIIDNNDNTQLVLPYDNIESINIIESKYQLIINTYTEKDIILEFLSLFEMYQGNSRINWVLENRDMEFLTKDYTTADLDPPVIIENTGITSIYPITRDINNNILITTQNLIDYFIDQIYDDRDGEINKYDLSVNIFKNNEIINLTGITEIGTYNISFSIADIANNRASVSYNIIINDIDPTIIFNINTATTYVMNIPNNVQNVSSGMTKNDIIRYAVNYAHDSLNNIIPNNMINININQISGGSNLNIITTIGLYEIIYSLTDSANNTAIYNTNMSVTGSLILYSGTTLNLTGATDLALIYTGDSGTTSIINLDGIDILIGNSGGNFVFDIGGVNEYIFTIVNEIAYFTIGSNIYSVQFNGYGSFYFTLNYEDVAPLISNITMYYDFTNSGISSNNNIISFVDDKYILTLDGDSSSVYNIDLLNTVSNRPLENTLFSVYLKNYELNDINYATLEDYYISFNNDAYFSELISGNTAFMYISGNTLKFVDGYQHDVNSIDIALTLKGDYPKGDYIFEGYYYDTNNYYNKIIFNITIN